jgi:hypothetical protein
MVKKRYGRIRITGRPRKDIDVDQMVQIIIALGREMAERQKEQAATDAAQRKLGDKLCL